VLPGTITLESFEPIAWRDAEVVKRLRGSQQAKLAQRHPLDPRIDGRHALTTPQPLGVLAAERPDHTTSI